MIDFLRINLFALYWSEPLCHNDGLVMFTLVLKSDISTANKLDYISSLNKTFHTSNKLYLHWR